MRRKKCLFTLDRGSRDRPKRRFRPRLAHQGYPQSMGDCFAVKSPLGESWGTLPQRSPT